MGTCLIIWLRKRSYVWEATLPSVRVLASRRQTKFHTHTHTAIDNPAQFCFINNKVQQSESHLSLLHQGMCVLELRYSAMRYRYLHCGILTASLTPPADLPHQSPSCPLNGKLHGPPRRNGHFRERKMRFRAGNWRETTRLSSLYHSHYTDWAITWKHAGLCPIDPSNVPFQTAHKVPITMHQSIKQGNSYTKWDF